MKDKMNYVSRFNLKKKFGGGDCNFLGGQNAFFCGNLISRIP